MGTRKKKVMVMMMVMIIINDGGDDDNTYCGLPVCESHLEKATQWTKKSEKDHDKYHDKD